MEPRDIVRKLRAKAWQHRVKARRALVILGKVYGIGLSLMLFVEAVHWLYPLPVSVDPRLRAKDVAIAAGRPFDSRTTAEVVGELRGKGVNAVSGDCENPFVAENSRHRRQTRIHLGEDGRPLMPLGMPGKTTVVRCNETGVYRIVETDAYGFFNPTETWENPVAVVVLGDAMAEGFCAASGESFADQMRKRKTVLNLAMAGNTAFHQLGAIREYARNFAPATVFWVHTDDDVPDLSRDRKYFELTDYLDPLYFRNLRQHANQKMFQPMTEELEKCLVEEAAADSQVKRAFAAESRFRHQWIWRALSLYSLRSLVVSRPQAPPVVEDPVEVLRLYSAALSVSANEVSAWGGRLVFVYLPSCERFLPLRQTALERVSYRKDVLKIVGNLRLPVVDLLPVFKDAKKPAALFNYCPGGHLSAEGHRVVADELLKAL